MVNSLGQWVGRRVRGDVAPRDALQRVEERLRTVVEGADGVIYIAEFGRDGRWIFVSPRIERILGFTADEWTADPTLWEQRLHPDDHDAVLAEELRLTAGAPGELQVFEYRMLTRSGETRWIRDAATIVATESGELVWSGVLNDVTERRIVQEELRDSEERLRSVIETASDAFVSVDAAGLIVEWNRKAEELFGWTRAEAIGLELSETIVPDRYRPSHRRGFEHFLRTGFGPVLGRTVELSAAARGGREFPVELSIWSSPVRGETRLNAFIRDITERKALEAVTHQAFHDALTDLPNRVLFTDRVEQALRRLADPRRSVAVLVVDLDDFKAVNDSLGHGAGDRLLVDVAARLRASLRPADTLARLAGDEFAILLDHIDRPQDAVSVARRIGERLAAPVEIDGVEIFPRASVGIAIGRGAGTSSDQLIRDADVALYAAKSGGKGGFEVFEPDMRSALLGKLELKTDLAQAIERDELRVVYQPCVRLDDLAIVGAEALVRWEHRERGLLTPEHFVTLAEETGLIVPVGRWVLRQACEQAAGWFARWPGAGHVTLRVNLSARQLVDPRIVDDVAGALADTGLAAELLVLEITESCLVDEREPTLARLAELRRLGVRFALDDFGTGYSSLSYLELLPIDIVKVDKSFVSALGQGGEAAMARAIVQLAHNLGMETIAEGVERPGQILALRALGCGYAQGYHIAPPASADELEGMLRDQALAGGRQAASMAAGSSSVTTMWRSGNARQRSSRPRP